MYILIDFDGTCVRHEFPNVGKDIGAVPVLKALVEKGHRLILFTMRSDRDKKKKVMDEEILNLTGLFLTDAVEWFGVNGIPLYGIQTNPTQHNWTTSPKAYGQLIIDDTCLGIPLIHEVNHKPYVDWNRVEIMLKVKGIL